MAGQISKAVAKAAERGVDEGSVRAAVERNRSSFAMALPAHVTADRFLRCALTALRTNPKLALCTEASVISGLMQAAQLGVEVNDVRGQAYLIPRWSSKLGCNEAVFQLGFRGAIDLAARGGITVDVDEICERDEYDFERGTTPRLYHKQSLGDRGTPIAYYAVAHFADDRRPTFALMSRREVEAHRDQFGSARGKSGDLFGPWVDHFDAMARKTVVIALLNYLPSTTELRQAMVDDAAGVEPIRASYVAQSPALSVPENVDVATGELVDLVVDPSIALAPKGTPDA